MGCYISCMKKIFIIAGVLFSINSFGQKTRMSNDTIYLDTLKFYKGQTIKLLYGTTDRKEFAFVSMGSGLGGTFPMPSNWSNTRVQIDKIYKASNKYFVRAKLLDTVHSMGGMKAFIDVEGAIDFKEVAVD